MSWSGGRCESVGVERSTREGMDVPNETVNLSVPQICSNRETIRGSDLISQTNCACANEYLSHQGESVLLRLSLFRFELDGKDKRRIETTTKSHQLISTKLPSESHEERKRCYRVDV